MGYFSMFWKCSAIFFGMFLYFNVVGRYLGWETWKIDLLRRSLYFSGIVVLWEWIAREWLEEQ